MKKRRCDYGKSSKEAKRKQIQIIEDCFEFYHPINKKTHKPKKSYIFTKQLKETKLIDFRRCLFPVEESNYLLNCLLRAGVERNVYFQRGMCNDVYVASSLIFKEFGFDVYNELNKIKYNENDKLVKFMFQTICIDAVKANTISRICKKFGYAKNSLPKGILRQAGCKGKAKNRLIPDNELLEQYNEYEKEYLEAFGCKRVQDALRNGVYFEILEKIKEKFAEDKKYGVKRYNIISVDGIISFSYDKKKKELCQGYLKEVVIASIKKSIDNRISGRKNTRMN